MSENRKMTQEEVISIKLAKNIECIDGRTITIGSTSKVLGGLTDEQIDEMRKFGLEVAKQVGVQEKPTIIQEIFSDESFQKELGLESEFCNEYWYVRREFEIAKYFELRKEIQMEILEIISEELAKGIKDSYKENKVYKFSKTPKELEKYIVDFKTIKEELGI